MIDGKTQVFGLLGNPIEHTLSPYIHRLLYDETQYNGTYNPFYVPEGQLEGAVKSIRALSLKGMNVTIPYKIQVMKYLDRIDPMALSIGACNTLVLEEHRLVGYNTDWLGLQKSCAYEGIELKGRDCVILGAGGSARAAALMCYVSGACSLIILNRTQEKAQEIISYIQQFAHERKETPFPMKAQRLEEFDQILPNSIVFQTTSVGMHPHCDATPLSSLCRNKEDEGRLETFFSRSEYLVDIIYNPKETLLMQQAKNQGVTTLNGLGMLFFQAVSAFELWTGITLTQDQTKSAMGKLESHVYGQEIDR